MTAATPAPTITCAPTPRTCAPVPRTRAPVHRTSVPVHGTCARVYPCTAPTHAVVRGRRAVRRARGLVARRAPCRRARCCAQLGITPLRLRPKEGLAIMNGTAVMTALACLAWQRADYLSRLATRLTALQRAGQRRQRPPLRRGAVRGQAARRPAARRRAPARRPERSDRPARNEQRLQDRYSLRCAPHVIGVLEDALPFFRTLIENELNSANDNPHHRRRARAGAAWRPLLRRPHRVRDGRPEERGRQRRRPAGPAARAAGGHALQPRPAGQPVGRDAARARPSTTA